MSVLPHCFGAFAEPYSDPAKARVMIVPCPYESASSFARGCAFGPGAILQASRYIEYYDYELGVTPYEIGIATYPEIQPVHSSPQEMLDLVARTMSGLMKKGKLPILLGGDHSITYGGVKAAQEIHDDVGVVVLDAHPDLYDEYQGARWGHAEVMRRVSELGIKPLIIGVRCFEKSEWAFAHKNRIPFVTARDVLRSRLKVASALRSLPKRLYLSIDLDVLDVSVMPAVGVPEPGGLGWYELVECLEFIARRSMVACDVVELTPQAGSLAHPFIAAQLVYKLVGIIFQRELGGVQD